MKTTIQGLIVAIFVAASLQAHAQGTLVYDQQSATGPTSPPADDFLNIQEDSPLMQSFIPSLSTIGFVQFQFWDIANNGNNGATVYVNLWEGSPDTHLATLLGSTIPTYMPNGFVNDGLGYAGVTNFYFSTPITLTPGQTYFIEPVVLSGDDPWDIAVLNDVYPNGRLYGSTGGYFQPSTDFWFREGVVPEPSTLALAGLSCLLVFIFKRRSKLPILFLAGILFTVSVLPIYASQDSVVQATADEAGLAPVSSTALPSTGTFWVMTNNPDGNLLALPYPFLPASMSALPFYSVTGNIFMVDDTGGKLTSASTGRMSTTLAASTVQKQAQTMENLIEQIEMADLDPTNISGTNGGYQLNGFIAMFDTNGIWMAASNEDNTLGLRLHNPTGNNYQLLSASSLSSTNWDLGQILYGPSGDYADFSPVPITNAMTFFKAHQASPVMQIVDWQDSEELDPTNTSDPGYPGSIRIYDAGSATNDVPVYFTIGGTAQNGVDYSNLTGELTIPVNQGWTNIDIDPIDDGLNS